MSTKRPDISSILERVADVALVKTDAAIARALGVTPQAIANARKRGTVPFEALLRFAADKGISLDFLLLGQGSLGYGGEVDALLMREICRELRYVHPQYRIDSGYHGALIYNRIIKQVRPEQLSYDLIKSEVKYLKSVLDSQEEAREEGAESPIPVPVHAEELALHRRIGIHTERQYGGPVIEAAEPQHQSTDEDSADQDDQ